MVNLWAIMCVMGLFREMFWLGGPGVRGDLGTFRLEFVGPVGLLGLAMGLGPWYISWLDSGSDEWSLFLPLLGASLALE